MTVSDGSGIRWSGGCIALHPLRPSKFTLALRKASALPIVPRVDNKIQWSSVTGEMVPR